jgi:hypothetical protein
MNICLICEIPKDAGFFDESSIQLAPNPGEERILASFQIQRNYYGVLMSFAQFTDQYAANPSNVQTTDYEWQIRSNGRPLAPYLSFSHIINPWGYGGFPIQLRLEENSLLEFSVRNIGGSVLKHVGGRLIGRYWYNPIYGDISTTSAYSG